jgi:flavin reductase (DIM6/NTAB) family NADH-FMN oxidoreductase RutF
MRSAFTEIATQAIRDNAFQAIGKEWMLITAGPLTAFNTMTASWGAWGEVWSRPVGICFVRPQRYTYGFMERAATYTLSFFGAGQRAALEYLGSHSGRDEDKVAAVGFSPLATPSGAVTFGEARLVLECRKLYAGDILRDGFVDEALRAEVYPAEDYHRMYVGEVLQAWRHNGEA